MRNIVALAIVCFCLTAAAQKPIIIDHAVRLMSKDTQPSYQFEIPQTTLKDVEKDWLKYLSTGSKGKATVVNGENLQPAAVNTNVSAKPFNVYSKVLETSEGIRITAWFTENDTVFLCKALNSDQDLAIQKYLHDFAVTEYKTAVSTELKNEQEKLKALEKTLEGLYKDEEKASKKISESNRSIQKSNDNTSKNNGDIQNMSYKISDQKGMVERTASDANANKGAKQTLKDLENQRKSLQKNNETEAKNIDNMNKQIREQERVISSLKEKQKETAGQIETQKAKAKEVQLKLDGIQ